MTFKKMGALLFMMFLIIGVTACTTTDDTTITQNVRTKIASETSVPGANVTVDTQDGVVTLVGIVDNTTQIQTLTNLAQSVEGVKRVDSRLTVKENANLNTTMPATTNTTPGTDTSINTGTVTDTTRTTETTTTSPTTTAPVTTTPMTTSPNPSPATVPMPNNGMQTPGAQTPATQTPSVAPNATTPGSPARESTQY